MRIKLHGGPNTEVKDFRITFPTWLPKGPDNMTYARSFGTPLFIEGGLAHLPEPDMVLTFEHPGEMYEFVNWLDTIRFQFDDLKRRVEIAMIKEEMYGGDVQDQVYESGNGKG